MTIVGMGALQNGRQARDMLEAGADVVAVGTEFVRDPTAGASVAAELAESLANSGIARREQALEREPIAHNA